MKMHMGWSGVIAAAFAVVVSVLVHPFAGLAVGTGVFTILATRV